MKTISGKFRFWKITLLVLLSVNIFHGSAVKAAWKYTHWKMNADEVVEASNGKAETLDVTHYDRDGLINEVEAKHREGPFMFDVSFFFHPHSKRLNKVVLKLENLARGPMLYDYLIKKYGRPEIKSFKVISKNRRINAQWSNDRRGNSVSYLSRGKIYIIEYSPLR